MTVDFHHRRRSQEAAELQALPRCFTNGRDDAHGSGLVVDDADCHLVGDDANYRLDIDISGNGNHIQADRADRGHSFQLLQTQGSGLRRFYHARVLADRDECPRQPADRGRGHHAAFLHGVVQQGQGRRCPRAAAAANTDGFQYPRHRVAFGRGRSQAQIQYAHLYAQPLRSLPGYQFPGTGNLESRGLDGLRHLRDVRCVGQTGQHSTDHTGAGNANVDNRLCLAAAMKGTGHERVVLHSVGEHHQLGTAYRVAAGRALSSGQNAFGHQQHRVHIDASSGRCQVDAGADPLGCCQRFWYRANQPGIGFADAFMHQRRKSANEVHADRRRRLVQGHRHRRKPGRGGGGAGFGHRGHRDALVGNRDAVFARQLLGNWHQLLSGTGQAVIDALGADINILMRTAPYRQPQGYRPDVKIVLGDHCQRF